MATEPNRSFLLHCNKSGRRSAPMRAWAAALFLAFLSVGCGAPPSVPDHGPLTPFDAGALDSGTDAGGSDAGKPPPTDAGTPVTCSPNHDGVIARGEVPLAAGLDATFRVATNVTFPA